MKDAFFDELRLLELKPKIIATENHSSNEATMNKVNRTF